jgi:hypothetical protein
MTAEWPAGVRAPGGRPALEDARRVLRDAVDASHAIRRIIDAAERRAVLPPGGAWCRDMREVARKLDGFAENLGESIERFERFPVARPPAEPKIADTIASLPAPAGVCQVCRGTTVDPASDENYSSACPACDGTGLDRVKR